MDTEFIKKRIETTFGIHICRTLPHGVEAMYDISKILPDFRADVIFDVGANTGQSANYFREWHKNAQIYCFEPILSTFQTLQANLKSHSNVHCFQLAFGANSGTGSMETEGRSDMFRLAATSEGVSTESSTHMETVQIETLDHFCALKRLDRIDFLKIDTEGHDLAVLKGAEAMLRRRCIRFIQVEAGMHPDNTLHVPMEQLKNFLEERNFLLFGIYNQMPEWLTSKINLRRSDLVFISKEMIDCPSK